VCHDAWLEWDLNDLQRTELKENGRLGTPHGAIRREAERHGWVFGAESLLSFVRCPSCSKEQATDLQKSALKIAVFANTPGDDEAVVTALLATGLAIP